MYCAASRRDPEITLAANCMISTVSRTDIFNLFEKLSMFYICLCDVCCEIHLIWTISVYTYTESLRTALFWVITQHVLCCFATGHWNHSCCELYDIHSFKDWQILICLRSYLMFYICLCDVCCEIQLIWTVSVYTYTESLRTAFFWVITQHVLCCFATGPWNHSCCELYDIHSFKD
jgi:hypothetical protein